MDWSKAKTILIIILLVVCLSLSALILQDKIATKKEAEKAIVSVTQYLESKGASVNCDIPVSRPSLPVLFVVYSAGEGAELTYKDYAVYTALGSSSGYVISEEGSAKANVRTASSAIFEMASQRDVNGLEIVSVELVYYIDSQEPTDGGEDTAIPYWMIKTSNGDYFINAFSQ